MKKVHRAKDTISDKKQNCKFNKNNGKHKIGKKKEQEREQ